MLLGDTIAAISSAAGGASRMIVRTSGPASFPAAARLCGNAFSPDPATARFLRLAWAGLSVPAWIYTFAAPRSYTGEDMVEYHLPGNPLLCRMLLDELLKTDSPAPKTEPHPGAPGARVSAPKTEPSGLPRVSPQPPLSPCAPAPQPAAKPLGSENVPEDLRIRLAEPGEFTARAHFNGKLPLEACEGVAAAIHASNQRELSAARRLLAGELAARLSPLREMLAQTLALVEAQIDFADEGISFLQQSELRRRLESADIGLRRLLADSARLARLAHEPRVLLVGRPNAGKSTLLNALCGTHRAIVSPEAGTTRDVIWAPAVLRRGLIHLADAAGLEPDPGEPGRPRPGPGSGPDSIPGPRTARLSPHTEIARQMQTNALKAAERADVLVLIRDATDPRPHINLPRKPDLIVRTKIDLLPADSPPSPDLSISVHAALGLDELRDALDRHCFGQSAAAETLALTGRHVAAIEEAIAAADRAQSQIAAGPELLALELREALDAVGRVLGQTTPDDLLGRIFSTFCIGK